MSMDLKKIIHKSSVDQKRYLTKELLLEQMDLVRGLMMMAYPGFHGLGEWEPIWVILENNEMHDEKLMNSDDLTVDKTTGIPCSFSVIKDAAVSSQLDSIPRINGFLLIQIVFINCTISIQERNKFNYEENNHWIKK